jgi:NAD+ synthase
MNGLWETPHPLLKIDAAGETERIATNLRDIVFQQLRRKGAVVGVSGGIDSAVVAALCAHALGSKRVHGVFMPESDSSPESLRLGRLLAEKLGISSSLEDISGILRGARCYERRDDAIRLVVPELGEG